MDKATTRPSLSPAAGRRETQCVSPSTLRVATPPWFSSWRAAQVFCSSWPSASQASSSSAWCSLAALLVGSTKRSMNRSEDAPRSPAHCPTHRTASTPTPTPTQPARSPTQP
ncbi:hypothetical protein O3P69_009650 [Scylla paramamosain]|uniref:Uncharacterized protein n=1 Tax=Scylla paramamosain TaxID=85552 RepID=A0AAW0SUK2_SCYPA